MTMSDSQSSFADAIYQVRQATEVLIKAGTDYQSQILEQMALALEKAQDTVLEANTLDLEASLEMAVPDLVLDWLKLTPERIQIAVKILRRLASLGDPRLLARQSTDFLAPAGSGFRQVVPLGVIGLVYEAFPELAAIAAGLCIRTGNGLVLKGGNEASQTNQAIAQTLQLALEAADMPAYCILSLSAEQGDAARAWLMQPQSVDLIIPYGRPSLVQQVVRQAKVPVLPTTMGNCYLYWSASGELDTVLQLILESHRGEPDAVNSIEKVLIHDSHSPSAVAELCRRLWDHGFRLKGGPSLIADMPDISPAALDDWGQTYLAKQIALRRVEGLKTAIDLINRYSSGHADCLVTESYRESRQFTQWVRSAAVYVNASPRFTRNPPQASAISLGMAAQQGGFRGAIGLDALMTIKQVTQGL
jgi:glutamate-5-semialdehyde dehydrogenase